MVDAGIGILDARAAGLVAPGARVEQLATGAIWSEGPVWMDEDESILWSDIPNNRMLRWQANDGLSVWREPAEFTNGHTRESDGSLLHCSHGLRAVVRTRLGLEGGRLVALADEVLVDRHNGARLNSPNDLVVKSDGSIWFTDPPYGIISNREGYAAPSEQDGCHVYRLDPRTRHLSVVSTFCTDPNGIAFSPDESILYVSDTSASRFPGTGNHQIVAHDVVDGTRLANPRVFAVIEPGLADGFRLDTRGWLYTSSQDSVQVYHPDGTRLAVIPVPEKVGNLTFGGRARDTLYICASTSLYRITVNARGAVA